MYKYYMYVLLKRKHKIIDLLFDLQVFQLRIKEHLSTC